MPYRREKTKRDKVAIVLWLLARHRKGIHSCAAHPRPLTSPHRRAGTYPLVAYELRSTGRTRPVCARILTLVGAGATRSAPHGSCHGSGIIRAQINTRTSQWSAPTMKTTMEEAGRRHGARRQKQTTTAVAVVTGRSRTAARAGRIRGDRVSNKADNDHATAGVVPNVILRCYREGQGC